MYGCTVHALHIRPPVMGRFRHFLGGFHWLEPAQAARNPRKQRAWRVKSGAVAVCGQNPRPPRIRSLLCSSGYAWQPVADKQKITRDTRKRPKLSDSLVNSSPVVNRFVRAGPHRHFELPARM